MMKNWLPALLGFMARAMLITPRVCKTLAESMEKKNGWLLFPLGIALSGKSRTPGGGTDLAAMMGKEETVKRVKAALEKL